jgi:hypothetical protein
VGRRRDGGYGLGRFVESVRVMAISRVRFWDWASTVRNAPPFASVHAAWSKMTYQLSDIHPVLSHTYLIVCRHHLSQCLEGHRECGVNPPPGRSNSWAVSSTPTSSQPPSSLSSNNICARQAAPPQDASEQNQELDSRGTNHQRPLVHLSRKSLLRIGGPGHQVLGTRRRRVDGLGIPGNVLCMPMG